MQDNNNKLDSYVETSAENFGMGVNAAHSDQVVLRPLSERIDQDLHPSKVIEATNQANYYKYGWMQEAEPTSAMNISAFMTLLAIVAAIGYLLAGTKLLKFIQFFITKKQYKRLNMNLKPEQVHVSDNPFETSMPAGVTPRQQNAGVSLNSNDKPSYSAQLLNNDIETGQTNRNGLCSHLSYHSRSLMQFYAPSLATIQLMSCSRSVILPSYVIAWQLAMRLAFITIFAAAFGLIFIHASFDEKTRNCLLSHEMRASSFFCLNKLGGSVELNAATHQGALYGLGLTTALVCTASMLILSHSIFKNFTAYVDKLIEGQQQAAHETDAAFSKAPTKQQQLVIQMQTVQTDESQLQLKQSPVHLHTRSPHSKKKKQQQNSVDQSISSFRALLDGQHSDSGSILPLLTHESGYDSSCAGHMSMSTQADRPGGSFFNMSQSSHRDLNANSGTPIGGATAKRGFPQVAGAPDLLPIDEDVDDEKCSPIKPKRRTDEDSPFKKHLAKQLSLHKSHGMNSQEMHKGDDLVISDEDEVDGAPGTAVQIAVGGFGIELDEADEEEDEDISSLNLNSGLLATPTGKAKEHKNHSSPNKSVEVKLEELIENELEGMRSQSGFRIQVEQVADNLRQFHFEGLGTVNSGAEDQEPTQKQLVEAVLSGPSRKNPPSIQVNSFSNVDDSTLQLETIAPFKHRVPSSTRNGVVMNQEWQMGNGTDPEQNMQTFSQQPLSVREANRPATGCVNLSLITPFHAGSSNNEVTDDRNSLGFGGQLRNTVEVLSSDQVSKNSCAIRPDSGTNIVNAKMATKRTTQKLNELSGNERLIQAKEASNRCHGSFMAQAFTATLILTLTFLASFDAYYLYQAADEGLAFVAVCFVAALLFDLLFQLMVTIILSAVQFWCEVKQRQKVFDTDKLEKMTSQAGDIARKVFSQYQEQTALLKLDYQEQEQQIGEENNVATVQPGQDQTLDESDEILVKESVAKITINGFSIEIRETLEFKPPRRFSNRASAHPKINIVQPNTIEKVPLDQMAFSSGDEEACKRRNKRKVEVGTFERSQKFFATQMPITQKHLRKRQSSNSKMSAKILRQSIDNIELENIEGDFASQPGQKVGSQKKSQTPEKFREAARKSSLAGQSSNQKVSQFETPRMSQVKLRHQSVNSQADGAPSDYELGNGSVGVLPDAVHRRLSLRRSSINSVSDCNNLAGRLDSVKKYAEDDYMTHGTIGVILGSSKSITVEQAGSRRSSKAQQENDEEEICVTQNQEPDKYSPVFSSVNRREISAKYAEPQQSLIAENQPSVLPQMIEDQKEDLSIVVEGILQQSGIALDTTSRRNAYSKQVTCPADMTNANVTASNKNDSSSSQLVQAILSQREVLSKHHSFNSPNSLHEKLQLTSEKIHSSIEKSSINKGRRKLVMLDEAGVSKHSLNFGGAGSAAQTSTQQQMSQVFKLHQAKSIGSSTGTINQKGRTTPINAMGASVKQIKPEPMGLVMASLQNSQVFMEDQGDKVLKKMMGNPLSSQSKMHDYAALPKRGSNTVLGTVCNTSESKKDVPISNKKVSEKDTISQLQASAAKRSSIVSRVDSAYGNTAGRNSVLGSQRSSEKPTLQSGGMTSAFQRLVQASKRMMQKKSSEKKDVPQNKLNYADTYAQARSNSLAVSTDTAAIMKEQSKAFFSQPFKIGALNKRIPVHQQNVNRTDGFNKGSQNRVTPNKRSVSDQPTLRSFAEPKPLQKSAAIGQKAGDNFSVPTSGTKVGSHLQSGIQNKENNCQISEIQEQESMEMDTPLNLPINRDASERRLGREPASNSSQYRVPDYFMKQQVNPVKVYQNQNLDGLIDHDKRKQQLRNSEIKAAKNNCCDEDIVDDYLKVAGNSSPNEHQRKRESKKGFKQRKNSQLTTTKEGKDMLASQRRKHSHQQVSGDRRRNSSHEGTLSSCCSIDFDKMDKHRDEDISQYSKLVSQTSLTGRLEDQRRRLESFLSYAQQAKSKRDIEKIQDMIRQIDVTMRPLPMSRINELKLLELMASPYNQSLIAMIKVELDIAKKVRDLKRAQQKAENSKSKYSLPKHLMSVASRAQDINSVASQENLSQPPCIVGGESDTRLTRVVNMRPNQGIPSCRSNNDISIRTFQRSPVRFIQQSPLSHGLQQPVLQGKGANVGFSRRGSGHVNNLSNERGRESSNDKSASRYSYLRSVGKAVVVHEDVRKSIERIRMSNDKYDHMKSKSPIRHDLGTDQLNEGILTSIQNKSDLDMMDPTRFEEAGRRLTAPTPFTNDNARLPNRSSLNYQKPEFSAENKNGEVKSGLVTGKQSQSDLMCLNTTAAENNERSNTAYGDPLTQKFGSMMLGPNDVIQLIAAPQMQSKSALAHNKENQGQEAFR